MSLRSSMLAALPGAFQDLGEAAVYTPDGGQPVACHVFIEFDVSLEPDGMTTQAWQRATVIEALLSELGNAEPNKDDIFVIASGDGAGIYKVIRILENDSITVKMAVK